MRAKRAVVDGFQNVWCVSHRLPLRCEGVDTTVFKRPKRALQIATFV